MASSRLRRRLEDVDPSATPANLSETFVKYGTPLPSIADPKAKDKNEYVPVWQQEVTDEQGRRRLHGAFTGGFSAGYFNTVGSKEGWAPSTFKSSRATKATHQQRVEDFMDEEDKSDVRQAQGQRIQTVQGYDPLTGQHPPNSAAESKASAAFEDLVRPSTERMGEKLLRNMGWREGQGVGPRISWNARKAQAQDLGISLADVEDEHERNKHLWAPLDRPLVLFEARKGHEGVGFQRGNRLDDIYAPSTKPEMPSKGDKRTPIGGAFGIGALEDADADDEDVFQTDDRSNYFQSENGSENVHRPMGNNNSMQRPQPPLRHEKVSKDHQQTFNDKLPVITGFVLSVAIQTPPKWFEPPKVPPDWKPDASRVFKQISESKKVQDSQSTSIGPKMQTSENDKLDAEKRGDILGEEPVDAPKRSVFEYMSSKDKTRLETAREATFEKSKTEEEKVNLPSIPASLAKSALAGFIPFGHDPLKQNRYRLYLISQSEGKDSAAFSQLRRPTEMSVQDFNKELDSFAASAKMFKPMSSMMAKRFTSSVQKSVTPSPEPGLSRPDELQENLESQEVPKLDEEELSPAARAVKMEMFGSLTRTVISFYPARLVCKRLNVPDPYPEGPPNTTSFATTGNTGDNDQISKTEPAREALNEDSMKEIMRERSTAGTQFNQRAKKENHTEEESNKSTPASKDPATIGLGEDDSQAKDVLTYKRPSMDIFEAIFANSDDEEEDGSQQEPQVPIDEKTSENDMQVDPFLPTRPSNHEASTVESGNIDTETFVPKFKPKRKYPGESKKSSSSEKNERKRKKEKKGSKMSFAFDEDDGSVEDSYKIKRRSDKLVNNQPEPPQQLADDEDEWVEKTEDAGKPDKQLDRARASDFL